MGRERKGDAGLLPVRASDARRELPAASDRNGEGLHRSRPVNPGAFALRRGVRVLYKTDPISVPDHGGAR